MTNHRNTRDHVIRDQAVRRTSRLRAALIGTSVAASLGAAGVLGASALTTHSTTTTTAGASASTSARSSLLSDLHTFASGQTVSQGSGSAHATTKGS